MNSINWDFSQHPDPNYDYDDWLYSTYDSDEVPDEEDFDCGWLPDEERCSMAGTEDCDFECPYHDVHHLLQDLSESDREKWYEGTVPDPI